jgi:drug/metabolite transporter (DMT)-like permease
VIYGLGAALFWGIADMGAALVGRRIGSLRTAALAQVGGLVGIWVVILVASPEWTWSAEVVGWLAGNGIVVAGAYVLHYRALELGPVALVGPITAAYAVVPIALAVVALGESLSAALIAGAAVTVVGVALATFDPRRVRKDPAGEGRAGIPYALAATVLFGIGSFVIAWSAQRIGALQAVGIGRVFTLVFMLPLVLARRPEQEAGTARRPLLAALAVGIVDVGGIVAYSRGAEVVGISLVTAVSATYPLGPVAGGMTLLGERPAPSQLVGAFLVIGGLVALGAAA